MEETFSSAVLGTEAGLMVLLFNGEGENPCVDVLVRLNSAPSYTVVANTLEKELHRFTCV